MARSSQTLDGHQHIFIGGLHRSGTSLLFRALRDHPQVSGFYALITFQFERRVNRFGVSLQEINKREAIKDE